MLSFQPPDILLSQIPVDLVLNLASFRIWNPAVNARSASLLTFLCSHPFTVHHISNSVKCVSHPPHALRFSHTWFCGSLLPDDSLGTAVWCCVNPYLEKKALGWISLNFPGKLDSTVDSAVSRVQPPTPC